MTVTRLFSIIAAAVVALATTVAVGGLPAGAEQSPVSGRSGLLSTVWADSKSNVWAAGSDDTGYCPCYTQFWHKRPAWKQVTRFPDIDYGSVAALDGSSATDVWAVGDVGEQDGGSEDWHALALHWNGIGWHRTPTPFAGRLLSLTGVAAVSANDAWAVGGSVTGSTSRSESPLVLHWDGTSWSETDVPDIGSTELTGVSFSGPDDGWAVPRKATGTAGSRQLLHWDGTSWTVVDAPAKPHHSGPTWGLSSVVAVSPTNAWATGSGLPEVLHWNGTQWSTQRFPGKGPYSNHPSTLDAMSASSRTDVWAVGDTCESWPCQALFMHWNGRKWIKTKAPHVSDPEDEHGPNGSFGVAAISPTDAWAVSSHFDLDGECGCYNDLLWHWNGTRWSYA